MAAMSQKSVEELTSIIFNRNKFIMRMYEAGHTYSEIARKIGATRSSVAGVIYRNRTTEPNLLRSSARKKTTSQATI